MFHLHFLDVTSHLINSIMGVPHIIEMGVLLYRNIDDVDKTMDEINEQTENMKQIQEALSAPIGAAADFDEVCVVFSFPYPNMIGFLNAMFSTSIYSCLVVWTFLICRMNWKQNLKSWKALSWKNNFFSQQQQLLLLQCKPQQEGNQPVLFPRSALLKKMNWLLCRLRWHFEQVR